MRCPGNDLFRHTCHNSSARTGALSWKRLVSATRATRATTPAPVSGQQHPLIQLLLTCTLFQGHRSFSDVNNQVVVVYCSVIFPIDFPEGRPEVSYVFPCRGCQWFRISAPFTSCSLSSTFGPFCLPLLLFFFFLSLVLRPFLSSSSSVLLFILSRLSALSVLFCSSSLSSFGLFCPLLLFYFLFPLVLRPFLSSFFVLLLIPDLVLRPFLSSSYVLLLISSRPSAFSVFLVCSSYYSLSSFGLFCPLLLFYFLFPLVLRSFLSSSFILLLIPSRPSAFSVLFLCSTSHSLSSFGLFCPLLMFYFLFPLVLSRPDITVPVDWA